MELNEFKNLVQVVKALRDPDTGCPWDLEQNHQSLLKYLFEESYEFKEAVEKNDPILMNDELGDILLQVLLHSEIASEADHFNLESVSKNLAEKLIRRHPHVFNNPENKKISAEDVNQNWHEIKAQEKGLKKSRAIKEKIIYGPALKVAENIGHKTKELNFDWENANQVAWKVEEEWQELKEELMPSKINPERIAEELGDFLFSAAQLARHLNLDPEELLKKANQKFLKRFYAMEDQLSIDGKEFKDMTQEQLDRYWTFAKDQEHK
ncbi:MAG: nucleoside triphosphate pyrophosphohydrolase [Bacteriovoracaceae bacterium]|nr:nucleoside triphosphate pyrophosphohydrolase [Bacteriovoracaceae bacterium]